MVRKNLLKGQVARSCAVVTAATLVFSNVDTAVLGVEAQNNTGTTTEQNTDIERDIQESDSDTQDTKSTEDIDHSELIQELQEKIDKLPTVDEFTAMADGTTVEDSTLNQVQTDVYNEAQSIAEAMDKLTDDEQGELDTGKLEVLFEYFNGMTEKTASNVISPSSSNQRITSGGTYTVKGGTYSNQIEIDTTEAVTLNIEGNITASDSRVFISVQSVSSNLTINGNGYTINQTGDGNVIHSTISSTIVTLNNCVFKSTYVTVRNQGTIYVKSGSYSRTGSSGQVFSNADGTLYIQGGTITNVEGTNDAVAAGNVYMTGGTVSAPNGGGIRLSQAGTKAEITGGTITGSKYGVYVRENNPNCTIGNVTFTGNTNDVYLGSGQKFTLTTDYVGANNIKVGVADTIGNNTKRQITTANTSQSMLSKVTSVNSSYAVNYDTTGKYLYLWKHAHTWGYSASGNQITAKCTSDSDCEYYSDGLTLTLNAPDMTYTGSAYDKASIEDNITAITGATVSESDITYIGRGDTSYEESTTAPTNAGTYTAKVTVNGATATADFTITKKEVTKPSASTIGFVYNGEEQTYNIESNDNYTVTNNTRTDAGSQTVTVALKDKDNCQWADGTTDDLTFTFEIAKANSTVNVTKADNLEYTGQEQKLVHGIATGTIYYRIGEDGEWSKDIPTGTQAQDYTIYYYVKGDDNHTDLGSPDEPAGHIDVTIANTNFKDDDITAHSYDSEYDKKPHSIDVELSDNIKGATITYSLTGEEGSYSTELPEFTDVTNGEQTIYYKVQKSGYNDKTGNATVNITPKEIGVEWNNTKLTYNGQAQTPTATATGLIDGDDCQVEVKSDEAINANTKNGIEYTATAISVSNPNYRLSEKNIDTTFTIAPKEVTVEWSNTELVYNGNAQAPTAKLNGVLDGEECNVTVSGEVVDANQKSGKESYTATATIDNDNYIISSSNESTEFTIQPKSLKDSEVKIALKLSNPSYTGNEIEQTVTSVELDGVLLGEEDYEVDEDGLKATDCGTYTVNVKGKGNYTASGSVTWSIKDTTAPTGEIVINENKWNKFLNDITFGHFFNKTQTVTINASDFGSGIDKINYYISNEVMSEDTVKALDSGKWVELKNNSFDIEPEQSYVIYVKLTDKEGNVSYISSDGFVIDKTVPTITGVENGKTYCEPQTITFADEYLDTDSITVNGEPITLTDNKYTLGVDETSDKDYVIVAKDKSGNETTLTVRINTTHHYGEPVFNWSEDHSKATVTRVCEANSDHVEEATCEVTVETTEPTCTEAGKKVYTAKVTIDGKEYTDEKEEVIKATGHDYGEPTFTWSDDNSSVKITRTCKHDNTTIEVNPEEVEVKVTSKRTEPTCEEDGKVVYTAKVTIDGKEYTDEKEEVIKATGHDYGEPTFTWSDDNSSVKITRTCKHDNTTIEVNPEEVEVKVTSKRTEPTCEEDGKVVYTAKVTIDGKEYTDEKEEVIKATGHDYGEPTFTWSDDNSSVKITRTCKHDNTTIEVNPEEVEVKVTSKRTEPTCEEDGKVVYTAKVTIDGKEYTDEKEEVIKATGHEYGEPTFTWSDDNSSVKITRTCKHDNTTIEVNPEEVEVKVTSKRTEPTCEEDGKVVYTAKVTIDGKEYTDEKEEVIKATGHDYGEPTFTWSDDNSSVKITRTCKHDNTTIEVNPEEVEVKVTSEVTKPTCTEKGIGIYTAKVTIDGKEYTDKKEVEFEALGHDWSGEWKVIRPATATENGKKEKTCLNECGQKKYEIIPATNTSEDTNTGTLDKDTQISQDAPIDEATFDNSKSELLEATGIFTEKEKADIKSGKNANVWLEITNTDLSQISEKEVQKVTKAAEEIMGDNPTITYFNAELFKQIADEDKTQIHEPEMQIKVTLKIADDLLNHDVNMLREYKIIRLHNGEVDVLGGVFDETTNEFTFETDKFSTYAIAYNDIQLVTGITVTPQSKTLVKKGETVQLVATITPDNAENKDVTWSTSDEKVVTVDENGLVTAVGNGTATITVTTKDGNKIATSTITVKIADDNENNGGNNNSGDNGNNGENNNGGENGNNGGNNNSGENGNNGGNNNGGENGNNGGNNNGGENGNNGGNNNGGDNGNNGGNNNGGENGNNGGNTNGGDNGNNSGNNNGGDNGNNGGNNNNGGNTNNGNANNGNNTDNGNANNGGNTNNDNANNGNNTDNGNVNNGGNTNNDNANNGGNTDNGSADNGGNTNNDNANNGGNTDNGNANNGGNADNGNVNNNGNQNNSNSDHSNNNNVVNNTNNTTTNNDSTTSSNNSLSPTTSKESDQTVTTGDHNNILGWVGLLMVSLAGIVGVFAKRKKKQD